MELRDPPAVGLREPKARVEGAPKPVKEGVNKDEAEKVKAQLEKAGAKVELKECAALLERNPGLSSDLASACETRGSQRNKTWMATEPGLSRVPRTSKLWSVGRA